jgi:tetratricopeptide (TPR) repeat protein
MAKDVLAEAVELHEAGNLKKAERLYRRVLKSNPRNSVALNLLGVLNYQVGRHSKAIQLIGKAVSISPDYAFAHFNLGNVYKYCGKLGEAEAAFRRVVALNSGDAEAHGNLGAVLQEQGRHGDARSTFNEAVALQPENPEAYFNLANVLSVLGEEQEAIAVFQQALEIRPDYAEVHGSLGALFIGQGAHEQALIALKRAVALKPDLAEAHTNLGFVQNELGNFETALNTLETAIGLNPDLAEAHNNLGSTLKSLHKFKDAVAAFCRAVALRPDFAEAHINLGNTLFQQEDLDGARAALDAALALDCDNVDTIRTVAGLWERANRPDAERPIIEQGLRLAPEDHVLNLLAAKCERRDGNVPAAIARLETIDRVSAPGRSAINIGYELGRLYDQQDDYVSAFSYFTEANKSSQHYPSHAAVDKNQFLNMVAALDAALSKDWIDGWRETPKLSGRQAPVFFFGFPRSGTTLVEQVLASHPNIKTLDELPAVDEMLGLLPGFPQSYPDALVGLTAEQIESIRARYFEITDEFLKGDHSGLLIDKMPLNIVHVAMMRRIFPQAKMILALRHPCDVCLSCFMQNFEIGLAMVNFDTLKPFVELFGYKGS